MNAPPRELTRLDLAALGINSVVGSSIFLFPGKLAEMLGPASIVAFGLAGLALAPVALCFAEAASSRKGAGGPALYAEEAFGPWAGFAVGWLCWTTVAVSWAAVASGLPSYAAAFFPGLPPAAGKWLAAASVVLLAAVNLRGAKPGARLTNVFTLAKLLPLVALALFCLPSLPRLAEGPLAPRGWGELWRACFLIFFAYSGFEVVPVVAGEAREPARDMPLAVLAALAGPAALYMLVQAGALAAAPIAGSERPLADAGFALWGKAGGALIAAGALVSMLGFTAGCALGGPRYLVALAEAGHLPARLGEPDARTGAPRAAVLLTSAFALAATLALDFDRLVDFTVLVLACQYLATCAAVLADRRAGRPAGFRAPGGPLVPLAGIAVTLAMLSAGSWGQLAAGLAVLASGVLLRAAARRFTPALRIR